MIHCHFIIKPSPFRTRGLSSAPVGPENCRRTRPSWPRRVSLIGRPAQCYKNRSWPYAKHSSARPWSISESRRILVLFDRCSESVAQLRTQEVAAYYLQVRITCSDKKLFGKCCFVQIIVARKKQRNFRVLKLKMLGQILKVSSIKCNANIDINLKTNNNFQIESVYAL